MLLIKLIIVSFVCLVSGSYMKDGDATSAITINTSSTRTKQNNNNKKTTNLTAMKESNIYNIKRLIPAKAQRPIARKTKTTTTTTTLKTKNIEKPIKQQQQQQEILQQQESNLVVYEPVDKKFLPSTTTTTTTTTQATTMVNKKMTLPPPTEQRKSMKTKKYKNVTKNSHKLNKKMLSKLGFTKVKAPNSHNRKRLAIESRRHASPDDSHMFIIKLPPNMYYYSNPKTSVTAENKAAAAAATSVAVSHNSLIPGSMPKKSDEEEANVNGKKVSFPFNSNGKPGRIYHWNLPIIEKLLQDKQRFPNISNPEQLMDIKNIPTWSKPWENEAIEKSYGHDALANYKKTLKRKSPTYYAPANTVNKNSFNKYFSGNGKPKGFYVIKENHKKPAYYKHITA